MGDELSNDTDADRLSVSSARSTSTFTLIGNDEFGPVMEINVKISAKNRYV